MHLKTIRVLASAQLALLSTPQLLHVTAQWVVPSIQLQLPVIARLALPLMQMLLPASVPWLTVTTLQQGATARQGQPGLLTLASVLLVLLLMRVLALVIATTEARSTLRMESACCLDSLDDMHQHRHFER
jgi:hypothetical protein